MTKDEIAARVRKAVADHFSQTYDRPLPALTDATRFVEDIGGDSLDAVEVIFALEDAFDIELPDDVATEIATIGQAVDALHQRLGLQVA